MLKIEQEQTTEACTICRPVGELDAFAVGHFRESLAELASKPPLIIDMSGVPFIDSAGLGALIGGIRRTRTWAVKWSSVATGPASCVPYRRPGSTASSP